MHIIVYSAPWCPDCREAKRFLDRYKLAYSEINIESTPGAADELFERWLQMAHYKSDLFSLEGVK